MHIAKNQMEVEVEVDLELEVLAEVQIEAVKGEALARTACASSLTTVKHALPATGKVAC